MLSSARAGELPLLPLLLGLWSRGIRLLFVAAAFRELPGNSNIVNFATCVCFQSIYGPLFSLSTMLAHSHVSIEGH